MIVKTQMIDGISVKTCYEEKIEKVLLCVHGFGGDKESSVITALANALVGQNFAVVAFDLPCHGDNDNKNVLDLNECFESFYKIINFINSNEILKGKPLSIFATSFGGFIALNCLSKKRINTEKVILRAPAIFMQDVLKNVLLPFQGCDLDMLRAKTINMGYEKSLLIDYKFYDDLCKNSLDKNFKLNKFLYIIQGRKDNIVDPKQNEKFFERFAKDNFKIFYIETADHRFKHTGELEKIVEITKNILL